MVRRQSGNKVDVEPCKIEIEAEEAGVPVGDYLVKQLNSLLNPDYIQINRYDVKAGVATGGYEYRVEVTFPTDELSVDEIYPLLKFSKQKDCGMWLAVGPKRLLQAVYIWTRPTKHDRFGDEPNQGR